MFEVLEQEQEFGGLIRSYTHDGFTFDKYGSHIIFSKNESTLKLMVNLLGKNKVKKRRNTKVLYKHRYVKYPFENGLSNLSKQDNFDCLYSFIQNKFSKSKLISSNLKEWCYNTFGQGIAEKYLVPYNEKIWKYPTEKLGLDWVSRIPNPPLDDIVKSSIGIKTEGYTQQLFFYYPKHGGIQALTQSLLATVNDGVTSDFKIKKIKKEGKKWLVSNGKTEKQFDKLVSTIPIQEIVEVLDSPSEVKTASTNLKYNSLICVMLGLNKPKLNKFSWLYIPDKQVLTHRISFPSNYGPYTAPQGKSSVLAEITCRNKDALSNKKDSEISELVISDLEKLKIFNRSDIVYSHVERCKYAYVINDLDYNQNLNVIKKFLSSEGIETVGRFSEYKYLNMDACIENAVNLVNKKF
jgi:protoporphyrinogen oxidase